MIASQGLEIGENRTKLAALFSFHDLNYSIAVYLGVCVGEFMRVGMYMCECVGISMWVGMYTACRIINSIETVGVFLKSASQCCVTVNVSY